MGSKKQRHFENYFGKNREPPHSFWAPRRYLRGRYMFANQKLYINFWPRFQCLTKISIFKNSDCRAKFLDFTKIRNIDQISGFHQKIVDRKSNLWNTILIFGHTSDICPKFEFLTKIWIFDQNFDFWPTFGFLTKIWIFDKNLDFWSKFRFLIKYFVNSFLVRHPLSLCIEINYRQQMSYCIIDFDFDFFFFFFRDYLKKYFS